jgi:hypothetical protein
MDVGLPTDTADMCYTINDELKTHNNIPVCVPYRNFTANEFYLPCWSTGELLKIINSCTSCKTTYEYNYVDYLVNTIYDMIKRNTTNPGTFDFSKLETMNEIEQIQKIIDGMKIKNIPLMEKDDANKNIEEYRVHTNATCYEQLPSCILWGRDIHTVEPRYGSPTYWHYEYGVEEKIKDDCRYKVWFTSRDAADTSDSTVSYTVWYIEELPKAKTELINYLKTTLKHLQ